MEKIQSLLGINNDYEAGCTESAFNYNIINRETIQLSNYNQFNLNYQHLSNLENGFGSQYNNLYEKVKMTNKNQNSSALSFYKNQHFIYRVKANKGHMLG